MKLAADAVMGISQGVNDRVNFIRNAVEAPGNWTGATRRAVLQHMQTQLPMLTKLAKALETGSNALSENMARFGMEDETGASDVGKAGAAAAQGGASAPTSTGGISEALRA
jgi:hypothetical protein